ncbi:MAG: class I adenylate-forming enzyme family protein [Pseudomonadota bacterium]|nr:class I adenylate-forming enzyme family protein [Pseudomonadota bacterium]
MREDTGNLGDIFSLNCKDDSSAVIDVRINENPRTITFFELNNSINALARGLLREGFSVGDRVAILSLNRVEFLEVLFGAMRVGCVPVMVNAKLPADQVQFILKDAGAKITFCEKEFVSLCGHQTRCVVFGADDINGYNEFIDFGELEIFVPGPNDVAEQPYTSGSTGRPKGVLLHHFGQRWLVEQLVSSRDMSAKDCSIISAPLYHKNALLAVKSALACGGRIVLLSRFDVKDYVESIEKHRLTILTGVPTMYALLLQQEELLKKTDLSSVRVLSMGSAPASEVLLDNLQEVFPQARINLNYGITEGGPILLSWKHEKGLKKPRASIGYPFSEVEIKLANGPNVDEGILFTRNPGVMLGYHNLPKETENVLKKGWLNTGDILRRDKDGWYFFVGRSDDMFVTGGENVYPGYVETLLERHPDVMQAVVVPAPNALKAHVPHAFIVARLGCSIGEEDIKQHALTNGPAFAHPRKVHFLAELPLAGTNKVDRNALKILAKQAAEIDGTV